MRLRLKNPIPCIQGLANHSRPCLLPPSSWRYSRRCSRKGMHERKHSRLTLPRHLPLPLPLPLEFVLRRIFTFDPPHSFWWYFLPFPTYCDWPDCTSSSRFARSLLQTLLLSEHVPLQHCTTHSHDSDHHTPFWNLNIQIVRESDESH